MNYLLEEAIPVFQFLFLLGCHSCNLANRIISVILAKLDIVSTEKME